MQEEYTKMSKENASRKLTRDSKILKDFKVFHYDEPASTRKKLREKLDKAGYYTWDYSTIL